MVYSGWTAGPLALVSSSAVKRVSPAATWSSWMNFLKSRLLPAASCACTRPSSTRMLALWLRTSRRKSSSNPGSPCSSSVRKPLT